MAELRETSCTRCGKGCLDFHRRGEEQLCIVCVATVVRAEERAACVGLLRSEAQYRRDRAHDLAHVRSQAHQVRTYLQEAAALEEHAKMVEGDGRYRDGKR